MAITTLMNERVSIGGAIPPKGSGPISEADLDHAVALLHMGDLSPLGHHHPSGFVPQH